MSDLRKAILDEMAAADDPIDYLNDLREFLHDNSPYKDEPVDFVKWVKLEHIVANDYNPNSVARNEMKLLHTSISHDGYTQPTVTMSNPETTKNEIVDGFHRYLTCKGNADINKKTHGRLPIVVIKKDINDRMASTIRHNRARGKHSITGMSQIVFQMLDNGWDDASVCQELGMEIEELVRLKHITGFSKLFENVEYKRAWETRKQAEVRIAWEKEQKLLTSANI